MHGDVIGAECADAEHEYADVMRNDVSGNNDVSAETPVVSDDMVVKIHVTDGNDVAVQMNESCDDVAIEKYASCDDEAAEMHVGSSDLAVLTLDEEADAHAVGVISYLSKLMQL